MWVPYQFFIENYFHSYFQIENFKRHICSKYLWINHLNWAQLWSTSTLKTILVPQLQVQKQWGDYYFCCLVKEQITSWSNTEQKRMTRNTSFHVVYEEWFHQRALQNLTKSGIRVIIFQFSVLLTKLREKYFRIFSFWKC